MSPNGAQPQQRQHHAPLRRRTAQYHAHSSSSRPGPPPPRPPSSPSRRRTEVHGVDLDVDVQDEVHLEGLALAMQARHCAERGGRHKGRPAAPAPSHAGTGAARRPERELRAQGRRVGNGGVPAHRGRTSCPRGRYLSHRRCPRRVSQPWRNRLAPAPATAHGDDVFPHPTHARLRAAGRKRLHGGRG